MQLITDTRLLDNLVILAESKESKTMSVRGVFQRADEVNNNKRRYRKKIMEREVLGLQDMINENRLCGELDHPSYDIVKLSNASHLITKLYMEGNDVIGEAKVLSTPAGMVAQELIRSGVKIGISSRGLGTLSEGKDGISEVNDDFKMITFDLVADPSTRGAFPGLSESKKINQIVESTMKRESGNKVLVELLRREVEKKLDEGKSTGGDPEATGERTGKFIGKRHQKAGGLYKKDVDREARIRKKISRRKIGNRSKYDTGFVKDFNKLPESKELALAVIESLKSVRKSIRKDKVYMKKNWGSVRDKGDKPSLRSKSFSHQDQAASARKAGKLNVGLDQISKARKARKLSAKKGFKLPESYDLALAIIESFKSDRKAARKDFTNQEKSKRMDNYFKGSPSTHRAASFSMLNTANRIRKAGQKSMAKKVINISKSADKASKEKGFKLP